MHFQQYFSESVFRKSKFVMHLVDLPMFSWFLHANMEQHDIDKEDIVRKVRVISLEAQKRLGKIGFPSMHVNVVIKDIKEEHPMGGYGLVPAEAMGTLGTKDTPRGIKYINVNYDLIRDFQQGDSGVDEYVVSTLVHEWAHIYLFNKPKQFAEAVQQLFNQAKNITFDKLLNMPALQFNMLQTNDSVENTELIPSMNKALKMCYAIWTDPSNEQLKNLKMA